MMGFQISLTQFFVKKVKHPKMLQVLKNSTINKSIDREITIDNTC